MAHHPIQECSGSRPLVWLALRFRPALLEKPLTQTQRRFIYAERLLSYILSLAQASHSPSQGITPSNSTSKRRLPEASRFH